MIIIDWFFSKWITFAGGGRIKIILHFPKVIKVTNLTLDGH